MLGFSLLKSSFQFVDVQYQDGKPVVNQFAKKDTPVPFTQTSVLDGSSRDEFRNIIEEAINYYKLDGPIVVTIDSQIAMVRKVMVDVTLPDDQLDEQINWEIRQIIPEDSLADYQYVYESLSGGYYENQKALLLVLFRKEVLEAVKSLFSGTPLEVKFVELDLFSALYGADRIFGIKEQNLCVFADLRKDAIQFLTVRKGDFFDSFRMSFNNEEGESEIELYESVENLANLVNKEVRRKMLEYKIETDENPVDYLFVFGEKANSELVEQLESNSPAKEVTLVEPFKKLELNPEIETFPESSSDYAVCVGSALRSIL